MSDVDYIAEPADDDVCCLEAHEETTNARDCMCGTARQFVSGFSQGERRFFLSKGQTSLVDIATALSTRLHRAELCIAVWTATEPSIRQVDRLRTGNHVDSVRWMLCDSQRQMNESRLTEIVDRFGVDAVRVTPLHAKLLTLRDGDWAITIQTSANLTEDRAVEQYDITDSETLTTHVERFFDLVWSSVPPVSEKPPFDGWSYEAVEERYQEMCLDDHDDYVDSFVADARAEMNLDE